MLNLFVNRNKVKPPISHSEAVAAIDALYAMETQANLAALRERQRINKREKLVEYYKEYWPVAVGLVISLMALQIHDMLLPTESLGMSLVFPFVVIAGRPEIYMGHKMAALLPAAMLYLQFPMEGFIARTVLKGKVTASSVLWQVLLYHLMAITLIWLLNGFMTPAIRR
jgi:hypothetical protein